MDTRSLSEEVHGDDLAGVLRRRSAREYNARVRHRVRLLGAIALLAAGCGAEQQQPLPPVSTASLVLHDEAELAAYLDAFPSDRYQAYEVPGVGRFLVDDPNERIKSVLVAGHKWEEHIEELLAEHVRPGSVALDLGAHIGTHTMTMSRLVGPSGRVYAFEPVKKIYRELCRNLALNDASNVVPLRYALGREPTRVIEMRPLTPGEEGGTSVGSGGDAARRCSPGRGQLRAWLVTPLPLTLSGHSQLGGV